MSDVRSAIQGDRGAFARLYERYGRAVFLDLVARMRRREDAEDVLQAAFLAAWRNLPRLSKPDRFVPWLFKIARNKARDHARRQQPRMLRLVDDADLIAPTGRDAPAIEEVRALMAGLKPETRAIVLLRAVEGWSAEDVARAQGMHAATVRRRYARALQHLRERSKRDDGNRKARRVGL